MKLVIPDMSCAEKFRRFRQGFLSAGEGTDTCGSLAKYEDIRDWIDEVNLLLNPETTPEGRTPRKQYVAVREEDGKIVGYIQIRYALNEYLEKYAGHIGYCVCPSERRKGYATRLLQEALPLCRSLGIDPVLVCCDAENEGSVKTILKNGGTFESTVHDPETGAGINRYWL